MWMFPPGRHAAAAINPRVVRCLLLTRVVVIGSVCGPVAALGAARRLTSSPSQRTRRRVHNNRFMISVRNYEVDLSARRIPLGDGTPPALRMSPPR